ncbi:hypothetical protein PY793_09410 [Acetobacter fabarum]|uniref:hypothetical protein n=1 Tax=Acetobacter fabarum TaxID=483199 RepID=UPI00312B5866
MTDHDKHSHPFLRAILPPPQRKKNKEDRLKAIAAAFQTVALSIVAVGLITPIFNAPQTITPQKVWSALVFASTLEILSLLFLLYIPYNDTEEG